MGNPKQKWTSEEEEALRAGVAKHGAGKWKNIQRDPEFNHLLFARSNIDLKDKWRNMNVASGQGPRDKSKTPKAKANPADTPSTLFPAAKTPVSIVPTSQVASTDVVMVDAVKSLPEGNANNTSKYNPMVYEALSHLKDPNGSDASTIASFIEQRHEVPANFRRLLTSRLRKLVQQNKLEKVQNCYRMKRDPVLETKTAVCMQKDVQPRQAQSIGYLGDTVEEAAVNAAYTIADAENKSFVAAEAVREAERVSKMAEDMDSLLQFAKDVFDQSSRGEIVLMA